MFTGLASTWAVDCVFGQILVLKIFVVNFEPHREEVGVLGVTSGARPGIPALVKN